MEMVSTLVSVSFNIIAVILVWTIKQQVHAAVAPIIIKVNELAQDLKSFKETANHEIETFNSEMREHEKAAFPHPAQEERLRDRYLTRNELEAILQPIREALKDTDGNQSRNHS